MVWIRPVLLITVMWFGFGSMVFGCAKAKVYINPKQADKRFEELFSAKNEDQEWTTALEIAQFYKRSGINVTVFFKKPNHVEYLEPMRFVVEKEAVAIIRVADEIYVWKPIDRKNVDAFFVD